MNANEIVKALHVLCGFDGKSCSGNCAACPADQFRKEHPSGACDEGTMTAAFALIESQAAKIAELNDFQNSQCAILLAKLNEAERRERAAVEMLIKFIKQSDDPCDYCKNHIECAGEQCEEFEKGVGGTGNDGTEFPDWHWQCTDFDYGTCAMLENTPCNGCFENDCSGFEWRGPQEARKGARGNV